MFPFLVILAMVLYFVPAFIAANREVKRATAIFFLNLLLGWTFVFWVVALVWALADTVEDVSLRRACPFCAETVFGFGAGIFFFSYFLFQVPASVMLERVGAP